MDIWFMACNNFIVNLRPALQRGHYLAHEKTLGRIRFVRICFLTGKRNDIIHGLLEHRGRFSHVKTFTNSQAHYIAALICGPPQRHLDQTFRLIQAVEYLA